MGFYCNIRLRFLGYKNWSIRNGKQTSSVKGIFREKTILRILFLFLRGDPLKLVGKEKDLLHF